MKQVSLSLKSKMFPGRVLVLCVLILLTGCHHTEKELYPSGRLMSEKTLKGKKLDGAYKTWYENGVMESQREINANKKHGLSFAWFKDGSLMLSEEYENDLLLKGSYFKKGDKNPVSKVESGKGYATLYDKDGLFLKKISYDKGKPILDVE